jgi:hypothetical protein
MDPWHLAMKSPLTARLGDILVPECRLLLSLCIGLCRFVCYTGRNCQIQTHAASDNSHIGRAVPPMVDHTRN